METSPYKDLCRVMDRIGDAPENSHMGIEAKDAAERFTISLCLCCLYDGCREQLKNMPDGRINAASYLKVFPDTITIKRSIPRDLWIPRGLTAEILELDEKWERLLSGFAMETLLDRRRGGGQKRKNEGIYYTPVSTVSFMIEQTLKPRLKKWHSEFQKAADECDTFSFISLYDRFSRFNVLDPACGWGIFTASAYLEFEKFYHSLCQLTRILLNRCAQDHFDQEDLFSEEYVAVMEESSIITAIGKTCRDPGRRILQNHLSGIDRDPESAEFARDLLTCLAERHSTDPPSAEANVKTADFFDYILNPGGKFDIIIGNPPYAGIGGGGRGRKKTRSFEIIKNHRLFADRFRSQSDMFYYFIMGAVPLLKEQGELSFIIPSYWTENRFADNLREYLLANTEIKSLLSFEPMKVFRTLSGRKVAVDAMILRASPVAGGKGQNYSFPFISAKNQKIPISEPEELFQLVNENRAEKIIISQKNLDRHRWHLEKEDLNTIPSVTIDGTNTFPLGDISKGGDKITGLCRIGQGQETGLSEVFLVNMKTAEELKLEPELLKPNIKNSNIRRYITDSPTAVIILTTDEHNMDEYPRIFRYLSQHREKLTQRQRVQKGLRKWTSISIPQNLEIFSGIPKIITPYRSCRCRFALDTQGLYNDGGDVRAIVIKNPKNSPITYPYLLGILNSSFIQWWYEKFGKKKGSMLEFFTGPLSRIPIPIPPAPLKDKMEEMIALIIDQEEKSPASLQWENPMQKAVDELVLKIYGVEESQLLC